jgi:hypothetical protein
MAGWLEVLEGYGGDLLDAASEATSQRIKDEITQAAPNNPADRPETQYDTQIEDPNDGPEQYRNGGKVADIWGQYKYWIAGGLLITGYLVVRRSV